MQHRLRKAAKAVFAGVVLSVSIAAGPAVAGCAGATAVDACMAGAWKQTGGGEVEWMIRNLPSAVRLLGNDRSKQIMVLNRDGGFWTMAVEGKDPIRLQGSDGVFRPASGISVRSRGQWSATAGRLNLCTETGAQPQDAPSALRYTCSGASLETVHTISGMPEPIVTRYERIVVKQVGQ